VSTPGVRAAAARTAAWLSTTLPRNGCDAPALDPPPAATAAIPTTIKLSLFIFFTSAAYRPAPSAWREYDDRRIPRERRAAYPADVAAVTSTDLRAALDVVYDLCSAESADPFPRPVLERLASLLGVHTAGYCETPRDRGFGGYELVTRPAPPWLYGELEQWARQDPTHAAFHAGTATPLAISDFLTRRAFSRLEVFQRVCRRNDVADSLRLYLPPSRTTARFFFFDQERRGFGARQRDLLELLRPHLALRRRRWGAAVDMIVLSLTPRELEILEALAAGATNKEIARRLWISPHTVRKHLEHIFEKLGVEKRGAASLIALEALAA
jgi:DNA-binding CsgD family transcriptional regulator